MELTHTSIVRMLDDTRKQIKTLQEKELTLLAANEELRKRIEEGLNDK